MGANYSFELKNIEIWAPAFFKHNNSFIANVLRVKLWIFSHLWKSEKNVLELIYLLSLLGNMIAFDNLAYACVYYNSCLSFFFTLTSNDAMFFECAQIPLLQPAGVAQCARVGQKLTQQKYLKSGFNFLIFSFLKMKFRTFWGIYNLENCPRIYLKPLN